MRRADGGFLLEDAGGVTEAVPTGSGFRLESASGVRTLESEAETGDLVLVEPGDDGPLELGRLTGRRAAQDGAWDQGILLADGRLLRIALRGLAPPRLQVGPWNLPAPYLKARLDGDGWSLERTAAGSRLGDRGALEVLVAAALGGVEAC